MPDCSIRVQLRNAPCIWSMYPQTKLPVPFTSIVRKSIVVLAYTGGMSSYYVTSRDQLAFKSPNAASRISLITQQRNTTSRPLNLAILAD